MGFQQSYKNFYLKKRNNLLFNVLNASVLLLLATRGHDNPCVSLYLNTFSAKLIFYMKNYLRPQLLIHVLSTFPGPRVVKMCVLMVICCPLLSTQLLELCRSVKEDALKVVSDFNMPSCCIQAPIAGVPNSRAPWGFYPQPKSPIPQPQSQQRATSKL